MFTLSPQLESESTFIAKLSLSQVRLMNNAHFTWIILVPEIMNAVELMDLNKNQQQQLLTEINHISRILKQHFPCDKINIAMLGNIVSQLHVHIIARRKNDICWPHPVWGGPKLLYTEKQKTDTIQKIKNDLASG